MKNTIRRWLGASLKELVFGCAVVAVGFELTAAFWFDPSVASAEMSQQSTSPAPPEAKAEPLKMTTSSLPRGFVGQPYKATLQAAGGTLPFIWTRTSGALPEGLSFNPSTREISGTPAAVTESHFTIRLTDSGSPTTTVTAELSISVIEPLSKNPITLGDVDRAPSGKPFTVKITVPAGEVTEANKNKLGFSIYFVADQRARAQAVVTSEEQTDQGRVFTITATVPPYEQVFKSAWTKGLWSARRTQVEVAVVLDQQQYRNSFAFAVPLRKSGTFWGVVILLSLIGILSLSISNPFPKDPQIPNDTRKEDWEKKPKSVRALLFPLSFAITPIGKYSMSLVQILFWTGIVLFASVYVFYVRGEFLSINDQILGLLGISGGTALASKANAVIRSREIPAKYFEGVARTRLPRLADLISIDGIPSIFKFQILAFTLVNGIIVLRQLYAEFNFPNIPTEQLTLMGISSAVYLGNEMTAKNEWETLKKKVEEAEKIAKETRETIDQYNTIKKEIKDMLEKIYQ
jgi:hypothetical protein